MPIIATTIIDSQIRAGESSTDA